MQSTKTPFLTPVVSILVGLILILPAAYFCAVRYIVPAVNTYTMSMTDGNVLGDSQFVGTENYTKLAEDASLRQSLAYTFRLAATRAGIAAVLPLLVGILMGIQGRIGRTINRTLLGLLMVIISPVALIVLWSVYWGQMWGTQPSPLWPLPNSQMLASPEGAQNSILTLDSFMTAVIALIAGGTAFMAVMRARQGNQWPVPTLAAVWLIGVLLAGGSSLLVFTSPYILTRGGPANSTTTLLLYHFKVSFQTFRLGYASAISMILVAGGMITGLIVWLILLVFRLRISTRATESERPGWGNYALLLSIPVILLIAYPLISLFLWGNGLVSGNGASEAALESLQLSDATNRSLAALPTIWLIQLPITYLAGLALGFLRPLGRTGSNILFLIFVVFLFIPAEALHIDWFIQARDAGIINTPDAALFPWTISAGALILFKLYFDGAYEHYVKRSETANKGFLWTVIVPSLPILALVGVVLSFMSVQSFMWPLISLNSPDNFPLTLLIMQLIGNFSGNNLPLVALALILIRTGIIFALVFAGLQVLVLDRFAIVGGKEASSENNPVGVESSDL